MRTVRNSACEPGTKCQNARSGWTATTFGLLLGLMTVHHLAAASATLAHLPNTAINAVQVDALENIYIAGYQGTAGAPDTYDAFVTKLTADGSKVLYSTKFAGSKSDFASVLALDSTGAAYILGGTQSPDFPATAGAQQPTLQAGAGQGFVAKIDPQGKVVYATLIDGSADVNATGGLLVTPAGELYASEAGFVIKLDAIGKVLAAVRGFGGPLATDAEGNVFVAGSPTPTPQALPVSAEAFQTTFTANPCGGGGMLGLPCSYQYVAKLDPALTNIVYSTYLTGSYGATPAAISVDSQGNAWVAGTTHSPDYPTTNDAFQPLYIASAPPGPTLGLFGTDYPPPASGYVTALNATGTALVYSTLFSGTQADTITFATFTGGGIHFSGSAGSADLPGLDGVPFGCLPETYEASMSLDGTWVTAARTVPGKALAYDTITGTFLIWTGTDLLRFDPSTPPSVIACILDAADMRPVTAIAPGELLAVLGPHFVNQGDTSAPALASLPESIDGVSVQFNEIAGPLLYLSPQQINVQAPYEIAGAPQVTVAVITSPSGVVAGSKTLPLVAANPTAFLDVNTPLYTANCSISGFGYEGGPLPLAFNSDGSRNMCTNPASVGTTVTILLQGLGVTGRAVTGGINPSPGAPLTLPLTVTDYVSPPDATIVSAAELPGSLSGVWQVGVRIADYGAIPITLTVGGVDGGSNVVRNLGLTIWLKLH